MQVANQAPSARRLLGEALDLPRVLLAPVMPAVTTDISVNGVPIIVVPGFTDSDNGTSRLVRSLQATGFQASGWEQGLNLGLRPAQLEGLATKLQSTAARTGQKVVLLGWSLGGLYAREIAKLHPGAVRLVMTLGSPFSGSLRNNNAWRLYEALNDHTVDDPPIASNLAEKPPVPTYAVWSPIDGIVAPISAQGLDGESDETIELAFTHMALGSRRSAIRSIIRLLSERL